MRRSLRAKWLRGLAQGKTFARRLTHAISAQHTSVDGGFGDGGFCGSAASAEGACDHRVLLVIKGLSTALGESTSDYMVHRLDPVLAVMIGFAGFLVALVLQLAMRRYVAWTYWFAVVMVGIFGTMAADVLHVRFHVPTQRRQSSTGSC